MVPSDRANLDGWLNVYKPLGISSAKVVAIIKNSLKGVKIGHTGTLDVEAEGVLPLAIGQATKLVSILVDSRKQYFFTIQFGQQRATGDRAGSVIKTTEFIPQRDACSEVCKQFIGKIKQVPSPFSAVKVNGVRAYKLARQNKIVELKEREVEIFNLEMLSYDSANSQASFLVECSKGTYVRSLAEDISLSLQSLGFVLELRRTKVGQFGADDALYIPDSVLAAGDKLDFELVKSKCLKVEAVLDDIPVLDVAFEIAQKVIYGQQVDFSQFYQHLTLVWLRYENKILAIGKISDGCFKSSRVFIY